MSVGAEAIGSPQRRIKTLMSPKERVPAPFIKWAGGKSRLVPALRERLPWDCERYRYVEPFVGGGALFFALQPAAAVLADSNAELITTYQAICSSWPMVLVRLEQFAAVHSEAAYYDARYRFNEFRGSMTEAEIAAHFIYLNKTCFNGVYRVNKQGAFNVPIGDYEKPSIVDAVGLSTAAVALQNVEQFLTSDFRATLQMCGSGDFVYCDPPYAPKSKTANFTTYTAGGFGTEQQEQLAAELAALNARGGKFMLSNSDTPVIHGLYARFRISGVSAQRSVNSNAKKRGPVSELVITNY